MKFIKLLTIIYCMFSGTTVFGQTKPLPARVVMKKALAEAATTQKNVFIIFDASWCCELSAISSELSAVSDNERLFKAWSSQLIAHG